MPGFRKRVRRTRKKAIQSRNSRYYSRRSPVGYNLSLIPRGIGNDPVPNYMPFTMKYNDTVFLNPGAGAKAFNTFSCNGMYDPDITNVGHQPLGFDQLMALYNHYTVLTAKITATFIPNGSAAGAGQQICGIYTDANVTAANFAVTAYCEQTGTRFGYLGATTATGPIRVTKTFDAASYFGKPRGTLLNSSLYRGSISANPSEQAYFQVFCGATDLAADPAQTTVNVQIEYRGIWSERTELVQS